MDPRACLDALRVEKIMCPCWKSKNDSTVFHPIAQSHLRGMAKGNHKKSVRIVSIQAMTRTWLILSKSAALKPGFQEWFWRKDLAL
jgi:hypothetical protein